MATIAITLLALGLLLSTFGVGTYLQVAYNEPDPDTLAIARGIATAGRHTTAWALLGWFIAGASACPAVAALLVFGTAAALATYSTKPGRLTSRGRPIA